MITIDHRLPSSFINQDKVENTENLANVFQKLAKRKMT